MVAGSGGSPSRLGASGAAPRGSGSSSPRIGSCSVSRGSRGSGGGGGLSGSFAMPRPTPAEREYTPARAGGRGPLMAGLAAFQASRTLGRLYPLGGWPSTPLVVRGSRPTLAARSGSPPRRAAPVSGSIAGSPLRVWVVVSRPPPVLLATGASACPTVRAGARRGPVPRLARGLVYGVGRIRPSRHLLRGATAAWDPWEVASLEEATNSPRAASGIPAGPCHQTRVRAGLRARVTELSVRPRLGAGLCQPPGRRRELR